MSSISTTTLQGIVLMHCPSNRLGEFFDLNTHYFAHYQGWNAAWICAVCRSYMHCSCRTYLYMNDVYRMTRSDGCYCHIRHSLPVLQVGRHSLLSNRWGTYMADGLMRQLCTCTQRRWLGVARHSAGCQLQLELRATGYWLVNYVVNSAPSTNSLRGRCCCKLSAHCDKSRDRIALSWNSTTPIPTRTTSRGSSPTRPTGVISWSYSYAKLNGTPTFSRRSSRGDVGVSGESARILARKSVSVST